MYLVYKLIEANNNDPPILGIIQQVKPYTWPTIQDQLGVRLHHKKYTELIKITTIQHVTVINSYTVYKCYELSLVQLPYRDYANKLI